MDCYMRQQNPDAYFLEVQHWSRERRIGLQNKKRVFEISAYMLDKQAH